MLTKLHSRARGESGFTLIELLVVILIIGILGAIAVPSFISQRTKAKDAAAKEGVLSARTAMETYATDNDSSYSGATVTGLRTIEPTLSNVNLSVLSAQPDGYVVRVTSTSNNTFDVARDANGNIARQCAPSNNGGCPASGTW